MILADVSATYTDVERSFTLPASPRLNLLGNESTTNSQWMISIEGHVYQDEACKTLEFIQRRFLSINPEQGSKTTHGKVISKKTGKVVQKRAASVNPHVATLLKNLLDVEWDFI
ncbi:hypothetical protein VZT92_004590 [Zoarces viviparus]|uniref:Uncharacterized protein n=1 Tax=Zoarces viviparus TaxID=48416 RepID=A0AAW1FZH0_ZOAVI